MSLTYFNHNFPLTLHHHHLCRCRLCHRTRSLNVKLIGTDGDTMASSCWHWNKNAPFVFLPTKQKPCVERFGFAFPISHSHLVVSTSDKCYSYCIHPLPQHTHAHSNFFGAKAKTITMFMLMMVSTMVKGKDLSHKHQINSIIKIIVIIWNKNENHLEELLYSNVLYCMIWKPNSMMENLNVVQV